MSLKVEFLSDGTWWQEQNQLKPHSQWAQLARQGHSVYHHMRNGIPAYVGNIRIDGIVYTYADARAKFFSTK